MVALLELLPLLLVPLALADDDVEGFIVCNNTVNDFFSRQGQARLQASTAGYTARPCVTVRAKRRAHLRLGAGSTGSRVSDRLY